MKLTKDEVELLKELIGTEQLQMLMSGKEVPKSNKYKLLELLKVKIKDD